MLGLNPTMPQKLAGLRNEPPMSEPCASRAARRAGGGTRCVPGIARRAEHFVESVGAGAELRRVRFGVDHAAIVFEMLDHNVGTPRDRILEDRRTLGVAHALDVEQILD